MYIKNKSGSYVEPCGTHELVKEEAFSLSTTLSFLFLKKLNNKFKM